MALLSRNTLKIAIAVIFTGILPVAAQQPQSSTRDTVVEDNASTGTANAQAVLRRNFKSVLGIEVRSSHDRNIGRIVDVLVNPDGSVKAAVIEFGGFLGIGTRKIAIAWPDLRFGTEGKQLVATLDIPRDQLRVAPEYKADAPAVVTKVIEPLTPSTEEPPNKVTQPPAPVKELKPSRKRNRDHRLY
jgi:PRC-barrel domain protein